ncbi:MAG: hypothetical protein H7Y31_11355, partial [Chitinophagaceae bacterium]|nr:hypothetical protein [Chitinophagaceae bacterium]
MKKKLFVMWFMLVMACAVNGQELYFRHLTTSEGLLSDLRLDMTEDRLGRLWIGSDEGINVFDGFQLTAYSLPDNSGLLSNNIRRIYCDRRGTIWAATLKGMQYKFEKETRFQKLENADTLFRDNPYIGETATGELLVISRGKLYQIDSNRNITALEGLTSLFRKYRAPLSFTHHRDDLWFVGFRETLALVDVKSQKLIKELPFRNTWCLAVVNDSTVMAGTFVQDSVVIINIQSGDVQTINHWKTSDGERLGGYAGSITRIDDRRFIIGSRYHGIYIIDVDAKFVQHYTHDPSIPTTLKSKFCRRVFVTRDKTMFAHTRGLSYSGLIAPQFSTTKFLIDKNANRTDEGINSFYEDQKGNFWISTNVNLALWDRPTGKSTYYPFKDTSSTQKFRTVRTVVGDRSDGIWVGTFGGGLGRLKTNGEYEIIKRDTTKRENTIPSNEIHSIAIDRSGNFIICANGGFAFVDPLKRTFKTFINDPVLKLISRNAT